jgi:hypothetical protein
MFQMVAEVATSMVKKEKKPVGKQGTLAPSHSPVKRQ